ncbi:MAG: ACT domain-containing protein [Candidatus Thermoplasmatota archaeon]|nr:ACT domain-containing protein [Candidatus Thermoplasmatota archaeon]
MERISRRVSEYLSSNPCAMDSLQSGIVNYSSLARYLMKQLKTQNFSAVLAAIKRYPERNPSLESAYKTALNESRIEAFYSMTNLTVRNSATNFLKVSNIYSDIYGSGGKVRVVQGSQGIVIVIDKKNTPDVRKKFPPEEVLSFREDLAELVVISPLIIEKLRGYVAYISTILAINGINVYQVASFYNDVTYIMDEKYMDSAVKVVTRLTSGKKIDS